MPLLDHFHPPISDAEQWTSFQGTWIVQLANWLKPRLPAGYKASPFARAGAGIEIDVATFQRAGVSAIPETTPEANGGGVATLPARVWTPPAPALTMPAVFPHDFEVRVISTEWGPTLVAAIELVSPANKDRLEHRQAFAAKCASYLHGGVSLIIVDIVTERSANLHNAVMDLMEAAGSFRLPPATSLYAVAYRPALRDDRPEIDLWPHPLALGEPLPVLPLRLTGDLFLPVELETTYAETCRLRGLP